MSASPAACFGRPARAPSALLLAPVGRAQALTKNALLRVLLRPSALLEDLSCTKGAMTSREASKDGWASVPGNEISVRVPKTGSRDQGGYLRGRYYKRTSIRGALPWSKQRDSVTLSPRRKSFDCSGAALINGTYSSHSSPKHIRRPTPF